jgi:hypothetical protein
MVARNFRLSSSLGSVSQMGILRGVAKMENTGRGRPREAERSKRSREKARARRELTEDI